MEALFETIKIGDTMSIGVQKEGMNWGGLSTNHQGRDIHGGSPANFEPNLNIHYY